jgi:hypothetical protein
MDAEFCHIVPVAESDTNQATNQPNQMKNKLQLIGRQRTQGETVRTFRLGKFIVTCRSSMHRQYWNEKATLRIHWHVQAPVGAHWNSGAGQTAAEFRSTYKALAAA